MCLSHTRWNNRFAGVSLGETDLRGGDQRKIILEWQDDANRVMHSSLRTRHKGRRIPLDKLC